MQHFSKLWSISPELIILYVFVLSNTSRCSNGQINVMLMVRERTRYFWTFRWHSTFCNFIRKAPAMQPATDNLYRIVLTGNAVRVTWTPTIHPATARWNRRKFAFRGISSTRIDVHWANDPVVIVGTRSWNFNGKRFVSRYELIVYFYLDGVSRWIVNTEKSNRINISCLFLRRYNVKIVKNVYYLYDIIFINSIYYT